MEDDDEFREAAKTRSPGKMHVTRYTLEAASDYGGSPRAWNSRARALPMPEELLQHISNSWFHVQGSS